MQKRKIITTIVLCLLGIMALLFGIFGKAACADPFSLTDAGIGQTVTLEMTEPLPGDENSFLLYYQSKERHIVLRAAVPDTLVREIERYSLSSGVPVTGILRESSDALDEASYQTIITFYESVAAYTEEFELTEELRNECREWIVPYYLEVTSVNAGVFPILKKNGIHCRMCITAGLCDRAALVSDPQAYMEDRPDIPDRPRRSGVAPHHSAVSQDQNLMQHQSGSRWRLLYGIHRKL